MTELIRQRGSDDCAVAVAAMYLGRTYEAIVELFAEVSNGQWKPVDPVNFSVELCAFLRVGQPSAVVAQFVMERPAIVSVLSLNFEDKLHAVYWDGREVFDPSLLQTVDRRTVFERAVYFTQRVVDLAPLILADVTLFRAPMQDPGR